MADEQDTTSTTDPAEAGATSSTADAGDNGNPEDYWRAEVKAIAKQRDELKAQLRDVEKQAKALSAAEARKQAEAGNWEQVAKKYETELEEHRSKLERLSALEEREAARVAGVREELAKLTSKLPKGLRDSIPEDVDPDAGLRMVRALHDTVLQKPPAADPAAAPTVASKRDLFSAAPGDIPGLVREMPSDDRRSLINRLLRGGM